MKRVFKVAVELAVVLALAKLTVHIARWYRAADWEAPDYQINAPAQADRFGRLATFPGKTEMFCPMQDDRTAVLLAIGQSNIANHAQMLVRSEFPGAVVGFYHGRCMPAASPLLGGSGTGGEWLTMLGDELIRSGRYDTVVIALASVGGQPIHRFADEDLREMLNGATAVLTARYRVTHVLWQQGESDFRDDTSAWDYTNDFKKITSRLRRLGVSAPVFVSVSTFCLPYRADWSPDNSVARAQRALVDEKDGIWPGVNTDAFNPATTRLDKCHFSAQGQSLLATAQAKVIEAYDDSTKK